MIQPGSIVLYQASETADPEVAIVINGWEDGSLQLSAFHFDHRSLVYSAKLEQVRVLTSPKQIEALGHAIKIVKEHFDEKLLDLHKRIVQLESRIEMEHHPETNLPGTLTKLGEMQKAADAYGGKLDQPLAKVDEMQEVTDAYLKKLDESRAKTKAPVTPRRSTKKDQSSWN